MGVSLQEYVFGGSQAKIGNAPGVTPVKNELICPKSAYFPTISCSLSDACRLIRFQISSVNIALVLLKTDVKVLIKAESIAAIMRPRKPKTS